MKKVKAEKVLDLSNPIVQAVLPLKKDAAEKAKQSAESVVAQYKAELKANAWDANIVAPYPKGESFNRWAEEAARSKYTILTWITEWDYTKQPGSRTMYGPNTVKMKPHGCTSFIARCVREAEAQYDAFVFKLTEKIGQTTTANLEGNHVWDESVLTVNLPDGDTQKWKTHQISNFSKLGKMFNQWPTRLMKP